MAETRRKSTEEEEEQAKSQSHMAPVHRHGTKNVSLFPSGKSNQYPKFPLLHAGAPFARVRRGDCQHLGDGDKGSEFHASSDRFKSTGMPSPEKTPCLPSAKHGAGTLAETVGMGGQALVS